MINPKITGSYISLKPLVNWMAEPKPIDWSDHFGRVSDIEVEIGFGLGDFLVRAAGENPGRDFVGIETGWPMVKRTLRKIALAKVKNVRILIADARLAMNLLFKENSLTAVYALFPCPWPKHKHERHRLFDKEFFMVLNSRLKKNASVLIVTDHDGYLVWLRDQIQDTGFVPTFESIRPQFATKYEKKWQDCGMELFHRVRLVKQAHLYISPMKETTLITRTAASFNPERFRPTGLRGVLTLEPKDFIYDKEQERGMLRIVVSEDSLLQDLWIEIRRREKGWVIKP